MKAGTKISQLHGRGRPVFSFEFFPPKTDEGARALMATVADLEEALDPDFVSVTYGAGGSTRDRTVEVVTRIQEELGTTTMAHLTCVGSSEGEIAQVVDRLIAKGSRTSWRSAAIHRSSRKAAATVSCRSRAASRTRRS